MMPLIALVVSSGPWIDDAALIRAFARVESGNRPDVFGDGGKSWGLYQFQIGRWRECGGDARKWGKAATGRDYQTQIMHNALERYRRRMCKGLTTEQQVIWLGRCHNGGRRTWKYHNEYTRKIWREYRRQTKGV